MVTGGRACVEIDVCIIVVCFSAFCLGTVEVVVPSSTRNSRHQEGVELAAFL